MKKTIFNVFVVMESQEQCDRMKQLCIDNGLPIWDSVISFIMCEDVSYFGYTNFSGFAIYGSFYDEETQVTEQEFIELLKEYKNEKNII